MASEHKNAPAESETEAIAGDSGGPGTVRRFEIEVQQGPAAGTKWESSGDRCSIGSDPSNDLVLDDSTVSRFHCEIAINRHRELHVTDLGSKNGTVLDGVRIVDAMPRRGSLLRVGRSVLSIQLGQTHNRLPMSDDTSFGGLVGSSVASRTMFALLERAAATDATVLLEGETGTGKEAAARSLHEASARAEGPYIIVDCGAIPANLLESELFGHVKGAFTGAASDRIGAFAEASGGTIFLDEIGELPIDLQPKLLRVLESRQVRRVGANVHDDVDVRIVAATNRDLRADVNDGRFRADLYYRLGVVRIALPALRERPEDIPLLVDAILDRLDADDDARARLTAPEFLADLERYAWKGNIRELRNYLEGCLVMDEAMPVSGSAGASGARMRVDIDVPFSQARRDMLDQFERQYIETMLARTGGNVSAAARAAGIGRVYFYKLLSRHGLR